jgi:tetratricopeptide (TPR) repeat protein
VASIARGDGLDLGLAQRLIVEGKAADAYRLLEPYEFEQAGDTKFDYLLGLAALNSGDAGTATIILERVLAVDPLHAAARVDLGRAYYLLRDYDRARAEFRRALALNPPPSALATIAQYMGAMEVARGKPETLLHGYVEARGGYNSNVNNSNSQAQIYVPALLYTPFTLNRSNVRTGDGYWGVGAGGEAIRALSAEWSLYAGADLSTRSDLHYNSFDFMSLDGRAGASFSKDAELVRGGLVAGQFDQGGAVVNHDYNGLNGEWRHSYDNTNQGVVYGQYLRYRYPDPALSSNDFNQRIVGLGWLHAFPDGRSSVFGSLFVGREQDTNLRIDGGKSIQGVSLSGQAPIKNGLDLFASGGWQRGAYDQVNSAFLVVRGDQLAYLSAGLVYSLAPKWTLRPQLNLIHNGSNIIIDRYDQADFSVNLRREFN